MLDNIKSNARIIANIITAGNAVKITEARAAPNSIPSTKANRIDNIMVIIPIQLVFLHFFFTSQQ